MMAGHHIIIIITYRNKKIQFVELTNRLHSNKDYCKTAESCSARDVHLLNPVFATNT